MPEITAAAVKSLREKTGLPMMECKKALVSSDGDEAAAIEALRKAGKKTMESRAGRETTTGRIGLFANIDEKAGAMVEVLCESAPVAGNEEFVAMANGMAEQLAKGPAAKDFAELSKQSSLSKPGQTIEQEFDDLTNRIREVFKVSRMVRIDEPCSGYVHHTGTDAVLLAVEGGDAETAKDICMHIVAMRPAVLSVEDLDPKVVEQEREILTSAARAEGKPEQIIGKMVEGRLRNFYATQVLNEQPFVKDDSKTVGKLAKEAGMKISRFVHWQLGKE